MSAPKDSSPVAGLVGRRSGCRIPQTNGARRGKPHRPLRSHRPARRGRHGQGLASAPSALKRDDALKVLPDAFGSDPDRLARFQREAQVLASLNHPNIAHVYGVGSRQGGVQAIVMELVDGPTLADRIAQDRSPSTKPCRLPTDCRSPRRGARTGDHSSRSEACKHQSAARWDREGARLWFSEGLRARFNGRHETASPTITSPALMTSVGVLLGTAAYMSPEQARGERSTSAPTSGRSALSCGKW